MSSNMLAGPSEDKQKSGCGPLAAARQRVGLPRSQRLLALVFFGGTLWARLHDESRIHENGETFGAFPAAFWTISPFDFDYETCLTERNLPYRRPNEYLA